MEGPNNRYCSLLAEGYDEQQAEEITFKEAEFAYWRTTQGELCPN